MSMNEQHFNYAYDKLTQRRNQNKQEHQKRTRHVHDTIPEYAALEEQLADTAHRLIMLMMDPDEDVATPIKELEHRNVTLQQRMRELLKAKGFDESYLSPIYTCPRCLDEGSVEGKWCECFNKLILEAAANDLNAVSPLELCRFEDFKLSYYSTEEVAKFGASPRDIMEQNLEFCKSYAASFSASSDSILMQGGTGLGKTHLSLSIANEVMKNNHHAVYASCPELLRQLEKEHFGRADSDTMEIVTKCDLLILDDIGAESEKKLYPSLLYEIINTRMCKGLPVIASTNLSTKDLQDRYEDRIASRLTSYEMLLFCGSDVRRIAK